MITKQTPMKEILEIATECDSCGYCCTHGAGFLEKEDIPRMAKFLEVTEEQLKKVFLEESEIFHTKAFKPRLIRKGKPFGVCIFYDEKAKCTIQKVKPLQCKAGNCRRQGEDLTIWFKLNYFLNLDDPQSVRDYSVYLDSGGKTIPGGKLEELIPDKTKLKEILNYGELKHD